MPQTQRLRSNVLHRRPSRAKHLNDSMNAVEATASAPLYRYKPFSKEWSSSLRRSMPLSLNLKEGRLSSLWKASLQWMWTIPLLLCCAPLYGYRFPDWWAMVDLSKLWNLAPDKAFVFLTSNVSYLLGGLILWCKFPALSISTRNTQQDGRRKHSLLPSRVLFSRYTWLSLWVWLAGLVSLTFHSVQTVAPYHIAEAWCFVDHGVAIASVAYFWTVCGPPTWPVWLTGGVLGGICLSNPVSSWYVWTHSIWHVLSAAAAIFWGIQHRGQRRARIELAILRNNYEAEVLGDI